MFIPLLFISFTVSCLGEDIPTAGSCDLDVQSQADFDFDQFYSENRGRWNGAMVPNTPFFKNVSKIVLIAKPAGKEEYHDVLHYTTKKGKHGVLADEMVTNSGNGVASAIAKDGQVYSIIVLKYVQARFLYYYTCSQNGGVQDVDYRYVLVQGSLKPDETNLILGLDKQFGFKGELVSLPQKKKNHRGIPIGY